jgi:trehalose-phosphatase
VANTKNEAFAEAVHRDGVAPYLTTRRFIEELHAVGIHTAVISASRNCAMVLEVAGMDDLFEVRVDGIDQAEMGFPGKPAPDVFLEAARRLGIDPSHAAVVEDAISGVSAGRAGGFGLVVGLDRSLNPGPLAEHADLVVPDAADLAVVDVGGGIHSVQRVVPARSNISDLPDALMDHDLSRRTAGRSLAVFCDYDGTLTPIVDRPEDARIDPEMLATLERLAETTPVAIVSGRDLEDVERMVDSDRLWFSGSHGFDVRTPAGERIQMDLGAAALPALDQAAESLGLPIDGIEGAWLERKQFAIAVHYRATPERLIDDLHQLVEAEAEAHDQLRMTGGKKILELRPAVEWDKGRAILWLMDAMGLDSSEVVPIFLGDDVTDEDGFVALRDLGVGIVVVDPQESMHGSWTTAAHDRLTSPGAVRELLDRFAET